MTSWKNWLATVCICAVPSLCSAQVFEIESVQQEGEGAPMRIMSFSSSDGLSTGTFDSSIMLASPVGGGFSFGSDPFSLLSNQNVQSELNLVDEQVEQLKDVQKRFQDRMREVTSEMRGEGGRFKFDESMIQKLKDVSAEIQEQKRAEIEGLLLPDQIQRLKEVALQTKMKRAGTVNALGSEEVAEALGLTEEQIEKLREKSKKLADDVRKEIEAVRERARKKLLSELTDEQQEKLEEMMGEKFEEEEGESRTLDVPGLRHRRR